MRGTAMEKTNIDFGIIEETFEIVIAFDQQGKILFGNKSAREKLDYSEEELKGHRCLRSASDRPGAAG